ncbi:MAG: DUF1501 domain-containing protein [Acidobacteria bacterium]|nr:DUF1501 domain-containing protein [Acidobacteriota bacterium]MBK9708773.1 DUF1501 domain-containing protein [Acidobacteriota bacterium]
MKELNNLLTRRHFFSRFGLGIGTAALASLLKNDLLADGQIPHFAPKAKRVIYLFQAGGPSQLDLWDYKPQLEKYRAQNLPDSVRGGQRLTGMTSFQSSFPVAPSLFKFAQYGKSGAWVSDLMPHTSKIVDQISFIKSMHTEQINHDPAQTFALTGFQLAGRPSLGAWISYGLGSVNKNLPSFIVMVSVGRNGGDQPLYDRLWGSGFLPSRYQGVKFHNGPDPVLYLSNPPGVSKQVRRQFLDDLSELNEINANEYGDPEIPSRIAQYEMAFQMQSSVPDLTDLSKEPEKTFEKYGPDARKPGTFAFNCILARRLAERDVRFIQLFHRGWDQHGGLPKNIAKQALDTDQPSAALIQDLAERGLLDDTLVIWGGEFGRTVYSQGKLTADDYGRDHHPRCFTVWLAGGGVKPGLTIGRTDDFSYNIADDPVHAHDLNATILHCLGIDHTRLTYKSQGRNFRLTDVHGNLINQILS